MNMKYSEQLEFWEQEAYKCGWGADWLEEIGECVKAYAIVCEMRDKEPTFEGLMKLIEDAFKA